MAGPLVMARRDGRRGALLALAVVLWPALAGAAFDFRTRAAGHVFQCGERIVEFGRDGPATLSLKDDPAILPARKTAWTPHGVTLGFGGQAGTVRLAEFGTTVSATAARGSAVCIRVR